MTDQFYYNAYSGLAWAYNKKKNKEPEVAYQYILIAGKYLSSNEQADVPFYYLIDKSYILKNLKRYDEVLDNLYQAEKLLTEQQKHDNDWNYLIVLSLRASVYFAQGHFESAYQLASNYIQRFVTVQTHENVKAIQDVRLKFESEQADLQKKILEKQRSMQNIKLSTSQAQNQVHQRYVWLSGILVLLLVFGVVRLVRGQKRLLYLSRIDGLTGIANRHRLEQLGELEFADAHHQKRTFCVLMIDIDNFKRINDQFGHKVGDEVLIKLSQLVIEGLREGEHFGRYGGEEFLLILSNTDINKGVMIAERLRSAVNEYHWQAQHCPNITVSIGVACFKPLLDHCFSDLIKRADELMYQAKNTGRNRVCG